MNEISGDIKNDYSNLGVNNLARDCSLVGKIKDACLKIWNFFRVFGAMCQQAFGFSEYKIVQIDPHSISPEMQEKLKEFESSFVYPFDDERSFRIIHGKGDKNYFGFFERMGECKFYAAVNKKDRTINKIIDGKETTITCKAGEIAAVGCGVLRKIPYKNNETLKIWYICDLKVDEKFRGEHLPLKIFQKAIWRFFQSSRGYGICMNPGTQLKPKAAKLWENHGAVKGHKNLTVNLYNLNFAQVQEAKGEIENILGGNKITFKSMKGLKDFEIFPNKNPDDVRRWDLLHIQHGPLGETKLSESVLNEPQEGHDHMIAAVEGSDLDAKLKKIAFSDGKTLSASSTATVVFHGVEPSFFYDKILTNEI